MTALKEFLHKRKLEIAGLMMGAFVVVLLYGLWLGIFFAIPMLNANYKSAAGTAGGDSAEALYDHSLIMYQVLLEQDKDKDKAKNDPNKMRVRGGNLEEVILKELGEAFTLVSGAEGQVPEARRKLAADIKFLAGNVSLRLKQVDAAREAYREALRLNPQHLYAKYNLEFLESPDGAGAGSGSGNDPGDPGKQPANGSGRPPRKGI